jgi:hypothetical protein
MNARYATNSRMLDDQARWARPFQRRVTGSQTRQATTSPTTAVSRSATFSAARMA